jgi:magnesium-transporting ATPase (P-type)
LLIKKIAALETSGSLIDICTGKTSTLTTGNLIVKKLHVGSSYQDINNPEINATATIEMIFLKFTTKLLNY